MQTGKVIKLGYKPLPFWRDTLHPALDKYRWAVIVAHRRFGKTVGSINHIIKKALMMKKRRAPSYYYIAPFLKQAKDVAWEYLKYYTSKIPNRKVNESELWVELPSYYPDSRGARIRIMGADRPDAMRGVYIDGIILDEYAQMKKEVWGEIIRPALADRKGWAVFIGTPKGQNEFYNKYVEALNDPEWFTCCYSVDQTGIIPPEELLSMKKNMTDVEVRQELYCEFAASAYDRLISIDLVNKAMEKPEVPESDLGEAPRIMGIDVARFGDDRSVIFCRIGRQVYKPDTYREVDNMTLAGIVAQKIESWNPDLVFIDAGRGEGVIDRLRQLGYNDKVVEVPFGGKAIKETRYINKRAEIWDEVRLWLEQGGHLPHIPELREELTTPTYTFDANNRIKLESKESIKERTGKSPDLADALCLTFSAPAFISRNKLYKRARRRGGVRKYGRM